MPVEQDWAFELDGFPVCLHTVDLDRDGRSESVVGTAPNRITLLSHSGKEEWTSRTSHPVNLISSLPATEAESAKIVVGCYPEIMVFSLDGALLLRKRIINTDTKGVFSFFKGADVFNDGNTEIVAISSDFVYIMAEDGRQIKEFKIGFVPRQLIIVDTNHDGRQELLLGNHTVMSCFNLEGERLWLYETGIQVSNIVSSLPARSRVERLFDITDRDADKPEEIVAGLVSHRDSSSVICFDLLSGKVRWRYETYGLITGVCAVKDGILVGGVYPNQMEGLISFLFKLDLHKNLKKPKKDLYLYCLALTRIDGCILIEEYNPQEAVQANALGLFSSDLKQIGHGMGAIYLSDYKTADLNADGSEDLVVLWWYGKGAFNVAGFLNRIPLIERKAEEAWESAEQLARDGNAHEARREVTRGKEILLVLDRVKKVRDREQRIERIIQNSKRWGTIKIGLALVAVLFCILVPLGLLTRYRLAVIERFYKLVIIIGVKPFSRPPVALLRELDREFLHEVVKKFGRIRLTLKLLENHPDNENQWSAFNAIFRELKELFERYRSKLVALHSIRFSVSGVERELKRAEAYLQRVRPGTLNQKKTEKIRDSIAKISRNIEENLRVEIDAHKSNIIETLLNAVNIAREDKQADLQKYSISIETEITKDSFAKVWFYDKSEHWQLIFLNLLRNAVEAIVKAIEEKDISQERRMVFVGLGKRFDKTAKAIVEIEDFGCGMDGYTLKHFSQHGFTLGKSSGMGVGVNESTIEFIKEQGDIKIESQADLGTKIIIDIWTK